MGAEQGLVFLIYIPAFNTSYMLAALVVQTNTSLTDAPSVTPARKKVNKLKVAAEERRAVYFVPLD